MTDKEIDKMYDLFCEIREGRGTCKYNEKDAFRTVVKRIDIGKQFIAQLEQGTATICQRIKAKSGRVGEWSWMKRGVKNES